MVDLRLSFYFEAMKILHILKHLMHRVVITLWSPHHYSEWRMLRHRAQQLESEFQWFDSNLLELLFLIRKSNFPTFDFCSSASLAGKIGDFLPSAANLFINEKKVLPFLTFIAVYVDIFQNYSYECARKFIFIISILFPFLSLKVSVRVIYSRKILPLREEFFTEETNTGANIGREWEKHELQTRFRVQ